MPGRDKKQGFVRLSPESAQSHNGAFQGSARAANPKLVELVKALARAAAERDFKSSRETSGQSDL